MSFLQSKGHQRKLSYDDENIDSEFRLDEYSRIYDKKQKAADQRQSCHSSECGILGRKEHRINLILPKGQIQQHIHQKNQNQALANVFGTLFKNLGQVEKSQPLQLSSKKNVLYPIVSSNQGTHREHEADKDINYGQNICGMALFSLKKKVQESKVLVKKSPKKSKKDKNFKCSDYIRNKPSIIQQYAQQKILQQSEIIQINSNKENVSTNQVSTIYPILQLKQYAQQKQSENEKENYQDNKSVSRTCKTQISLKLLSTHNIKQKNEKNQNKENFSYNQGSRISQINLNSRISQINQGSRISQINSDSRISQINQGSRISQINSDCRISQINQGSRIYQNFSTNLESRILQTQTNKSAQDLSLICKINSGSRISKINKDGWISQNNLGESRILLTQTNKSAQDLSLICKEHLVHLPKSKEIKRKCIFYVKLKKTSKKYKQQIILNDKYQSLSSLYDSQKLLKGRKTTKNYSSQQIKF